MLVAAGPGILCLLRPQPPLARCPDLGLDHHLLSMYGVMLIAALISCTLTLACLAPAACCT
jgi:hypothetical protein